jgi:DNA-directed RNA polymerase specialized sigma24 family protein
MSSTGSVTAWIGQLQKGEETALGKLHARYWGRLLTLARQRLRGFPGCAADEEDVAQEAFWDFYRCLKAGRAPRLASRHDLLALLTHLVACRAINQIKHEFAVQKRGARRVRGGSAFDLLATGDGAADDSEHTPLEHALLHDCYRHYVEALPERLRAFAELYLAGSTIKETAAALGCSERTVERKIALLLERWQEMATDSLVQSL